jgi:hypothetical protein
VSLDHTALNWFTVGASYTTGSRRSDKSFMKGVDVCRPDAAIRREPSAVGRCADHRGDCDDP